MLIEFFRFSIIGALATVAHYSILVSLVELVHAPLVPSTSMGFVVGAIISYSLNRRLTFRYQIDFGRGLIKFVLMGAFGLTLNALFVATLQDFGLQYIGAQMIATACVLIWNFIVSRQFIFRPQLAEEPDSF